MEEERDKEGHSLLPATVPLKKQMHKFLNQ